MSSLIKVQNIDPNKAILFEMANAHFQEAVLRLEKVVEKYTCKSAVSFGKDSSITCLALIHAYRNVQARIGKANMPGPLIIYHGNTGVENPILSLYAKRQMEKIAVWLSEMDIAFEMHIGTPDDRYSWPVMYLSGLKLITTFVSKSRDCSIVLKRDCSIKASKRIIKKYGSGRVVDVLGSRNDESSVRKKSNEKFNIDKGEIGKTVSSDGRVNYSIAPIFNLTSHEVWNIIRCFGSKAALTYGDYIEYWDDSSWMLERIYDSASDQCQAFTGVDGIAKGGCDARTGCAFCAVVPDDKSARQMVAMGQYRFMEPLLRIRNYIVSTAQDMDYRRFQCHCFDESGKYAVLKPTSYTEEWYAKVLQWVLQVDRDEKARAMSFKALVDAGRIEEDEGYRAIVEDSSLESWQRERWIKEYIKDMSSPMFEIVDVSRLLLIQAFLSRQGMQFPDMFVVKLWNDVYNKGVTVELPTLDVKSKVDNIPENRFIPLGNKAESFALVGIANNNTDAGTVGVRNLPVSSMVLGNSVPDFSQIHPKYVSDIESLSENETGALLSNVTMHFHTGDSLSLINVCRPSANAGSGYTINLENAEKLLTTDLEWCLEQYERSKRYKELNGKFETMRTSDFYSLLKLGVLCLSRSTERNCSRILNRTEMLYRLGFNGDCSVNSEKVAKETLSLSQWSELVTVDDAKVDAERLSVETMVREYSVSPIKQDIALFKALLAEIKKHTLFLTDRLVTIDMCIEMSHLNSDVIVDGASIAEHKVWFLAELDNWTVNVSTDSAMISLLPKESYMRQAFESESLGNNVKQSLSNAVVAMRAYIVDSWINSASALLNAVQGKDTNTVERFGAYYSVLGSVINNETECAVLEKKLIGLISKLSHLRQVEV